MAVLQARAKNIRGASGAAPTLAPLSELYRAANHDAAGAMGLALSTVPIWSGCLPLQTSLKINAPGDKYEQEADRVAKQVMRMPEQSLQRKTCSCGKPMGPDGECAACKQKKLGIQRMASSDASQTTAPPIVHQVLQQLGRPLDGPTRNFMESRFGQDFGRVRVHTNGHAAESARAINARAYTLGQNVVFANNEFQPNTQAGQRLLAHELVHTIQQGTMITPFVARSVDEWLRGTPLINDPDIMSTEQLKSEIVELTTWLDEQSVGSESTARIEQAVEMLKAELARRQPQEGVRWQAPQGSESASGPMQNPGYYADEIDPQTGGYIIEPDIGSDPSNGSVILEDEQTPPEPTYDLNVCGPDVTDHMRNVLHNVRVFEPSLGCPALITPPFAVDAWDINQLHDSKSWLASHECSRAGKCSNTVQVEDRCYHINPLNYVVFGAMMKSCGFSKSIMITYVYAYKEAIGSRYTDEALLWAAAGYAGWPTLGATPNLKSTESECKLCGSKYDGPQFTFDWYPDIENGIDKREADTGEYLDPYVGDLKETA